MKPKDLKYYIREYLGEEPLKMISPKLYRQTNRFACKLSDNLRDTDRVVKDLASFANSMEAVSFVQKYGTQALRMINKINVWLQDIENAMIMDPLHTKAILGALYILSNELEQMGVNIKGEKKPYNVEFGRQFIKTLLQRNAVSCNHVEFILLVFPHMSMHEAIHYYNHDLDIKNTQQ